MSDLQISVNSKSNSYNLILIIVGRLIKMVYYKLVKVTINTASHIEVIINIEMRYYDFLK